MDKVNVGGIGGAPTCSRCSQRVYFNEEKRAIGKVWHTRCFTCGKFSLKITFDLKKKEKLRPLLANTPGASKGNEYILALVHVILIQKF